MGNQKYCKGEAILTSVIFFLFISLLIVFGSATPTIKQSKIAQDLIVSKQSYFFAEGALEDAIFRISFGKNMPSEVVFQEGTLTATTTVSDIGEAGVEKKQIEVIGVKVAAFRKLKTFLTESGGTVFNYASQVGELGLEMYSNSVVNGNVFSNGNIVGYTNSKINGDALAVGTISSPVPQVSGTKTQGVDPIELPPLDAAYWKAQANINNDPIEGNVEYNSGSHVLGPRRINGNLTLNSNAKLTVTGPLYITGNLAMNSNAKIFLDESFGSEGTVIIADGSIKFNSNSEVHATSASPKGYIIFASLKLGSGAIELNSNTEIEGVIYALNGWVAINSNGEVTAVTGRGVLLNANAELNYDLGLRDLRLSGGPAGGWEIDNWREMP